MKKSWGIFLPSVLSVVLFVAAIFFWVLPQTEQAFMDQKKEMLSRLGQSVWSMLSAYDNQVKSGELSLAEAQADALGLLRPLRYGDAGKDYFWVTDLTPRMVMHPYRPDLEGQDLSQYKDIEGNRFFWDYTREIKQTGHGFVSYYWQWKDNPERQAKKTSYIRLFKPWGWVVGTGIYTDDVIQQVNIMKHKLVLIGLVVSLLVGLLTGYVALRTIRADKQRQAAQDSLSESEERFRSISANALDGIVMSDTYGKISFWNRAAESIFGYTADEALGRDLHLMLAHPQYHAAYEKAFARFQGTGTGDAIGKVLELTALRKGGAELSIELSVAPLKLQGKWHAVGIVRDITQRKLAETSLQKSEEKFRKLFYASPVMLTISTMEEGRFIEVNDAVLEEFGYERDQVVGKTVADLRIYLNRNERRDIMREHLDGGDSLSNEVVMRRKDGSLVEMMWRGGPMRYEGQNCLLSVLVDITETKNAQREKLQLEDRLRQAQKMEAVGTLAGGIAHDFNNILGAVLGYSEIALISLKPEDKSYRYISEVIKAGLRARDLVQQILAFSRQTKVEKTPIEIRTLAKEIMKMMRATIPATISIVNEVAETDGMVLADPSQLHQMLLNLCTNAAHAMAETGGTLRVSLEEATVAEAPAPGDDGPCPGSYMRLVVEDTGCGMAPQVRERIFEPFFTTKAKGEGTGMGLSVVHGIVQDLGGCLDVHSQEGEGTTFTILLPRYLGEAKAEAAPALEMPRGTERVLVVDDEESVADTHRLMLESLGYRVTACHKSDHALTLLQNPKMEFDLVITDLAMPYLDGISLIRQAHQVHPDLRFVLVTGFADSKKVTPELLEELKVAKVVIKPVVLAEIAAVARQALDSQPIRHDRMG